MLKKFMDRLLGWLQPGPLEQQYLPRLEVILSPD
jgi:hypothetical protein